MTPAVAGARVLDTRLGDRRVRIGPAVPWDAAARARARARNPDGTITPVRVLPIGGAVPCGIHTCTAERCVDAVGAELDDAHARARAATRGGRDVDAELVLLALALPHRPVDVPPDDDDDDEPDDEEDAVIARRLALLSTLETQPSVWRVGRTRPTAVPLPRTRRRLSEDERAEAVRLISAMPCRHTVDRHELAAETWIELAYPTCRVAARERTESLARRVSKAAARAYARLRPSAVADGLPTRYRVGNGAGPGLSPREKGISHVTKMPKRKSGARDAA